MASNKKDETKVQGTTHRDMTTDELKTEYANKKQKEKKKFRPVNHNKSHQGAD